MMIATKLFVGLCVACSESQDGVSQGCLPSKLSRFATPTKSVKPAHWMELRRVDLGRNRR